MMAFTGKKLLTDSRKRVLLESKLQVLSHNGHIKKKQQILKRQPIENHSHLQGLMKMKESIFFFLHVFAHTLA